MYNISNKFSFLRLWAANGDDSGGGGDNSNPTEEPVKDDDNKTKVVFTKEQQEHIDALIAAQYAKVQSKADKKLEEIKQAERLKSMSESERAKAELEIAQAKLEEYAHKELVSQFKVELLEKKLPQDFAELLNVENAEEASKAITFLADYKETIIKEKDAKIKELEEGLKNVSLRGPVPKDMRMDGAAEVTAITRPI